VTGTAGDCWLGVDLGTSACKVIAVDDTAALLATSSADYPMYVPRPAWVEQDPQEWWAAVASATRDVVAQLGEPRRVRGIGLCGQMHGLVPLDEHFQVLRRAILWNDQRSGDQCHWIVGEVGGPEALLALTSNGMLPGYTAGKLVWLREREPDVFARMRSFANPKDYLRLRMTGDLVTDVSDASGTGMLDVRHRRWSQEVVDAVGVAASALPEVAESDQVTGYLRADAATELGLVAGTPVVAGGGDAVLQTSAMGIVDPGPLGITIGTAGIVAAAADHCPDNPGARLQVSCGNASDRWHVMGVALNVGGAWEWWRSALAPLFGGRKAGHDTLVELARGSVPGARGARFLPYLLGERCPHVDPSARAGWMGLDMGHDLGDMTRAIIEGALFNLRQIRDLFEDAGLPVGQLRVSGGAVGAALLAGVATGAWPSLDAAVRSIDVTGTRHPSPADEAAYRSAYESFRSLYPAVQGWCQSRHEVVTP
jgi:xylulokinase